MAGARDPRLPATTWWNPATRLLEFAASGENVPIAGFANDVSGGGPLGSIANSIVDAKGDLIAATAADIVARFAVGADRRSLRARAAATAGLQWDPPSPDWYNVRDTAYGATGDGATNDTTAIHAARDAAGVGGTVYVPPGTYNTPGLTFNVANQTIVLAGGASIFWRTGAATNDSLITVSAVGVHFVGQGQIDGNRANQTADGLSGIYFSPVNPTASQRGYLVEGLEFTGINGTTNSKGIYVLADHVTVVRCFFHDSDGYGVASDIQSGSRGTHYLTVEHCRFQDLGDDGILTASGTTTVASYRHKLIHNTLINCSTNGRTGFSIETGGDQWYGDYSFNYSEIQGFSFVRIHHATVIGNIYRGATSNSSAYGLEVAGEYMTVANNDLDGRGNPTASQSCGIAQTGLATTLANHNTYSGNVIRGFGTSLYFGGACEAVQHTTIIGNTFEDSGHGNGMLAMQAQVGDGADWKFFTITGNTFNSPNSTAIHLSNGAAGVNNVLVSGNTFLDCPNVVGAVGCDAIRVHNNIIVTVTNVVTDFGATANTNVSIKDNRGWNPVGGASITPGASPYTYTAGPSPEIVYIRAGTVSVIAKGGRTVFVSTDKTVHLEPNQAVVVTYSSAPTMEKDIL